MTEHRLRFFRITNVMISPKRVASALRYLRLIASVMPLVVTPSQAQTHSCANSAVLGHWQGTMSREGADVSVAFDFVCVDAELRASFTSVPQRAMEYPFDSAKQIGNQVDLVLGGDTSFSGKVDDSELTGTFKHGDGSGIFRLKHIAGVQLPYTATDVVFKNGNITLSGSLYVPRGGGLHPVIVMLQASGPETRWGASRFWAD
jgi:hypothetical protein